MFTYDNDIFVKSLRRRVIVCTKGLDTWLDTMLYTEASSSSCMFSCFSFLIGCVVAVARVENSQNAGMQMDPKFLRNQKYAKKNNAAAKAHPKNRSKGKTDHFGAPC